MSVYARNKTTYSINTRINVKNKNHSGIKRYRYINKEIIYQQAYDN